MSEYWVKLLPWRVIVWNHWQDFSGYHESEGLDEWRATGFTALRLWCALIWRTPVGRTAYFLKAERAWTTLGLRLFDGKMW